MSDTPYRFEIGATIGIVGGGVLTPAEIIGRERYSDGAENYRVRFTVRKTGKEWLSWILSDDLMPLGKA